MQSQPDSQPHGQAITAEPPGLEHVTTTARKFSQQQKKQTKAGSCQNSLGKYLAFNSVYREYNVPYFISYRTEGLPFQNSLENLDPSKMIQTNMIPIL